MPEKSVFRKAWSPEMKSQSFPVSCFWSRGFVPHRKWNLTLLVHQNTGKENRYRKFFFAIHISTLRRFNRANKKKSVIYTLTSSHLYRKNIFIWVVLHKDSFWHSGKRRLGNGLLKATLYKRLTKISSISAVVSGKNVRWKMSRNNLRIAE